MRVLLAGVCQTSSLLPFLLSLSSQTSAWLHRVPPLACHPASGDGDVAGLCACPPVPPPKGVPCGPEGAGRRAQLFQIKLPVPPTLLVSQGLLRQKDLGREVPGGLELSGHVQGRCVEVGATHQCSCAQILCVGLQEASPAQCLPPAFPGYCSPGVRRLKINTHKKRRNQSLRTLYPWFPGWFWPQSQVVQNSWLLTTPHPPLTSPTLAPSGFWPPTHFMFLLPGPEF